MGNVIIPTKSNLLAQKRSLALSRMGYDLMDKKRNILIREMMMLIERAKVLQNQIDIVFSTAYHALEKANITMGLITDIVREVEIDNSLKVQFRSVMGVEIPIVDIEKNKMEFSEYSYTITNSAFDEAFADFIKVKELCAELAEVENSVYRLAYAVKKTQKRANALKNIVIPLTQDTIKYISSYLEEKEREEFTRLKIIKSSKS